MTFSVAYIVPDHVSSRFTFVSCAQYIQWRKEVWNLKDQADAIHDIARLLDLRPEDTRTMWWNWLDTCNEFISQFGEHLVPSDIRHAINDVRHNGFGVDEIEFPDLIPL